MAFLSYGKNDGITPRYICVNNHKNDKKWKT